jgi:hypothetical protein
MKNLRNRVYGLDMPPHHPMLDIKKGREISTGQVTELVDRRRQDGASFLKIPIRIVSPTAKKGDTIWSS